MKKLYALLFTLSSLWAYAQNCPYIGPDLNLPCGVTQTTLTANLSQCGPGANPNQTTAYTATTIPYVPQVNNGTSVFLTDDSQAGPFNIGFNFCFYGATYTQFYIGSNGWISFSAAQPTNFTSAPIPNAGATVPKNCIMSPWQDWNPGLGGQIRYQVQGVAPCRKLVVSWIGVPMFSCTNLQGTFHIVIYESTNYIETYLANKPNCPQWANGTAVHGIHNLAGNAAVTVPGRNSTQWTAINDGKRWTPSGPPVVPTPTWYQVGNPIPLGTGLSIVVNPPLGGAYYTCHLEYGACNTGWNTCNAIGVGLGPDTIHVITTPNLPPPVVVPTDPLCNNACTGSIQVNPAGGVPPYAINWNGVGSGFTLNNLCAGTYPFTLTDANGCTYTSSATLNNPPPLPLPLIVSVNPVCNNDCNGGATVTPQGGLAPYTYLWSNGQTGQAAGGLCAGNYSVTVTDANSCTVTQSTLLTNPPLVMVSPITGSDTVCYLSTLETYTVINQPGYTYQWSTVGSIVSGQGTSSLGVDWSAIVPGFIPGAVQVTAFNAVGCSSLPTDIDLTIYNVVPTIMPMGPYCSYDPCETLSALPAGGVFTIGGNPVTQFCPQSNGTNDSVIYVYTQSGCAFDDTATFVVNPQPDITDITPDDYFMQLCEGDTASITYLISSTLPGTVDWSYGETSITSGLSQNFVLSEFGTFIVTAVLTTPEGCVSPTVTTTVTIQECPNMLIYIPNTFTPDGNEHNQTWAPVFTSGFDPAEFVLTVFNRWGETIWESRNHAGEWDGTYNGSKCQDGTYTYKVWFGDPKTDAKFNLYGHFTLIR